MSNLNEETLSAENAEGWRPKEGDVLIGEVVDVTAGWSDYANDYYPIVTVQPETGNPVAIHCFHQVLRDRMVELKPVAGEKLGVKFKGTVKSKDGKRDISVYNVKVEGRDASGEAWGQFGPSARQAAAAQRRKTEAQQGTLDVTTDSVPEDDDIPF